MDHLNDIPWKNLAPGIRGKYIHGTNTTFGYVVIEAGSILTAHHHMHEQITHIVSGALQMKIGEIDYLLTAGMIQVIPSNTPHSALAQSDCIVIDVFSPVRDDYR